MVRQAFLLIHVYTLITVSVHGMSIPNYEVEVD